MTPQVREFVASHADKLTGKVLEVGSLNVNGSIRDIVPIDTGIDFREGEGVDFVCRAEHLADHFIPNHFDSVVSTETLEHIEHWKEALTAISRVVKPGGWWVFTMASMRKGLHNYPNDYWRFTEEQLQTIFPGSEPVDLLTSIGWAWQNGEMDLDVEPQRPVIRCRK